MPETESPDTRTARPPRPSPSLTAKEGESAADRIRRDLTGAGYALVKVDGECMLPTLRQGQSVVVHGRRRARVGDVVLLDAQGWLEIHRVTARIEAGAGRWVVHVGDASDRAGVAAEREILGVVAGTGRRPAPALWAHARGLALRMGAVFRHLGIFVESTRKSG